MNHSLPRPLDVLANGATVLAAQETSGGGAFVLALTHPDNFQPYVSWRLEYDEERQSWDTYSGCYSRDLLSAVELWQDRLQHH